MKEDGGKEVNSGLSELGFSRDSSTISHGVDSLDETRGLTSTVEMDEDDEKKREAQDSDFERRNCEKRDVISEEKMRERGMKNGSDIISLHEARECSAAAGIKQLGRDNNGNLKEIGEERSVCDFLKNDGEKRGGFFEEKDVERKDEIFEKQDEEKEIETGFVILSLHEARECSGTVEIDTEGDWDEKEKTEQGPDCHFESNGDEKTDEICEKKEGEIEMKNGFDINLHESKKRGEIYEKEEGENEIKSATLELNTEENGNNPNFDKKFDEKRDELYKKKVGKGKGKDGDFEKKEGVKVEYVLPYPQREGKKDCPHYLKTGICLYGYKCFFNHPPKIANQFNSGSSLDSDKTYEEEKIKNGDEKREKIYEKNEGVEKDCQFEKKEGVKVKYALPYPQRNGKQDCPSYLRTGFCSYGYKCYFNHPPQIANQFNSRASLDYYDEAYDKINNEAQQWGGIYENKEGEERDGEFDKKEGVKVKYALPYSERKGRQDCASYLESGFCSYGYKCCYNHPPQIANQFNSKSSWDYDDTYEQEFVNNGSQYLGLSVRQGQKDCPYYMKQGSCKYSIDCRFNHPNLFITKHDLPEEFEKNEYIENNDPLNYEDSSPPCLNESLSENSASSDFLPVNIKSMILPKYEGDLPPNIKAMLLPPQRLHDTEQVPLVFKVPETYEGYSMESNTTKSNSSQQIEDPFEYLESPDKQECDYYINHGYCKFKSTCKFKHPRDQLLKDYGGRNSRNGTNQTRLYDAVETEERLMKLHQKGLMDQQFTTQAYREGNLNGDRKEKKKEMYPERPGKPECGYYMKHGDCKFKFTCKFHHPKDPYRKAEDAE